MGKTHTGCISKVEVVLLEDGLHVVKETKAELEVSIMASNEARFQLTENTPMIQEPLRSELSCYGCTEEVEQILAGSTYECPLEVDDFTPSFLKTINAMTLEGLWSDGHRQPVTPFKRFTQA